jgi:hypothetical protein
MPNRLDYFFAHMDEVAAAHIVGLFFGAGARRPDHARDRRRQLREEALPRNRRWNREEQRNGGGQGFGDRDTGCLILRPVETSVAPFLPVYP